MFGITTPKLDLFLASNEDYFHAFQWMDDSLASVTLVSGGAGYPVGQTVEVGPPGLGGEPAIVTATVASGVISGLTLVEPGNGFDPTDPPPIYFPPVSGVQGTGAIAYARVGNPISLTGSDLRMQIRRFPSDAPVLVDIGNAAPLTGIALTNAALGQFTITIPRTSFATALVSGATYAYDILQLRSDGVRVRILAGTAYVDQGVTRP